MNETYETICRYINWNEQTNYDTMKLNLSQDFTREELSEAEDYARSLMGKLREAGIEDEVVECNGYYGDSIHDFMCHMVSKGEAFVDQLCESRTMALEIFKDGNYTENFFYCFPREDEYDEEGNFRLLTGRYYWKGVVEIKKYLQDKLHGTSDEDDEDTGVTRYDSNFNKIEDVMTHEDVKYLAELLDEIWHLKWNSNRDYKTIEKHTEGLGHGWIVCNLWGDMGKYYAKVHPECVIGDGKFRRVPDGEREWAPLED